jgi:hypothetical protein
VVSLFVGLRPRSFRTSFNICSRSEV